MHLQLTIMSHSTGDNYTTEGLSWLNWYLLPLGISANWLSLKLQHQIKGNSWFPNSNPPIHWILKNLQSSHSSLLISKINLDINTIPSTKNTIISFLVQLLNRGSFLWTNKYLHLLSFMRTLQLLLLPPYICLYRVWYGRQTTWYSSANKADSTINET